MLLLVGGWLATWLPVVTLAATLTTIMSVGATVEGSCSSFTSSGLNFGSIPQGGGTQGAAATVTVTCGNQVPFEISTDGGGHPVCAAGAYYYQMGGSSAPAYRLFIDAARTVELAHPVLTGCSPGTSLSATGTGQAQSFSIYAAGAARTAAGEPVEPGSYADTVTLTLTF